MKSLMLLGSMCLSLNAFASQDKCYDVAREAAFHFVKDEEVTTIDDFSNYYGDEAVEVYKQNNGWQKEFWSFANYSQIIFVEVHSVTTNCHVKKVESGQNDQDWE